MKALQAIWTIIFFACFFTLSNTALASKTLTYFPSATIGYSNLDNASYQFNPIKDYGYGESFYLNSHDPHGNVVTALISMTNYNPFNKGMGSFDINWVEGGKTRTVHQEFDQDEIKKDTTKGTLFGEHSYLKVDHSHSEIYYLGDDTNGEEVEIRIIMHHTEAGAQSGDSRLYFDADNTSYWGLKMLAPRGKVTAQLKTKNTPNHSLTLNGYLDHGNANAKVPDFSDHWYRLMFFSDEWTINLHEITPKFSYGKQKPQMLYVAKNNKAIGMFSGWSYVARDFAAHDDSPYEPPRKWEINFEHDDIKINGEVKVVKEALAIDVLGSVSWAVRMLVKAFYSNAWQHYLLVEVDLTIEHNGELERVKGIGMATAEYY